MTHADSFISKLQNGYDTAISQNDTELSLGQKQMLCLCRAALSRPSVLVLDEATSSVDSQTERLIQDAMLKMMQGKTSIVIAHRLSTIQDADVIAVFDNGTIAESGTHQALLNKKGIYYHLYQNQSF